MIWNRFPKYSYKVTDGNGIVLALCGMNKYIITTGFNTVHHGLLLDVLEKLLGITDAAKKWHHNYLKPRKFRVLIEEDKSQPRQLDYLVLQGSIHWAFLFISYVLTWDELVTQLTLKRFANDHSVRRTFKSSKLGHTDELETITIIESSILDIKSWMDHV